MERENYLQQLADYIKKNLAKGYTLESLKIALESQDYSKISIERAIELVNEQLAASAPLMKEKPVIKYAVIQNLGEDKEPKETKEKFLKKLFK